MRYTTMTFPGVDNEFSLINKINPAAAGRPTMTGAADVRTIWNARTKNGPLGMNSTCPSWSPLKKSRSPIDVIFAPVITANIAWDNSCRIVPGNVTQLQTKDPIPEPNTPEKSRSSSFSKKSTRRPTTGRTEYRITE